jgi:hypothetical protein
MGDLSDFEKGTRLAGASVTKTAILLGVSRPLISKVMLSFTNHGNTTSAKRNSGHNSTLTERDRRTLGRIVPKNHRTTAAELNIHFEAPISTKTDLRELPKSNIHGRAAIAKPLITECNIQMRERWCHDNKTWTSDKGKRSLDVVR